MAELAKYGQETKFYFPLITVDDTEFGTGFSHVEGDVQVSKDGATFENATNGFVEEGNGIYSITLTTGELQCAQAVVTIIDQGTKAWEDQSFVVDTYGNASAQHAFDLDTAHNDPTAAAIAAAVWDLATTGHVDSGSFGAQLKTIVDSISAAITGSLSEITGASDAPATPTIKQALMLLYMWLRNNTQVTSAERRLKNDAGTTVLEAEHSDDDTTYDQGKLGTPD